MSILIRNMDMPKNCTCCPLVHYYEDLETGNLDVWCKDTLKLLAFDWEGSYIDRPDWCPISNVSTPHGRLIDADELPEIAYEHMDDAALAGLANALDRMPTIIEAEE